MRAFLNERVANLSRAIGGEDADLRAALIVSSILGLTIARHFLELDAFASAADADIARVARPVGHHRSRPRPRPSRATPRDPPIRSSRPPS